MPLVTKKIGRKIIFHHSGSVEVKNLLLVKRLQSNDIKLFNKKLYVYTHSLKGNCIVTHFLFYLLLTPPPPRL